MQKIKIIVGAFILGEKKKILLISSNKWAKQWSIVGGHLEHGEKLEDGVIREVFEETGLQVKIESFLGFQEAVFDNLFIKDHHCLVFDYLCSITGGNLTKSEEAEEFLWADSSTENISPFTKQSLFKYGLL